MGPAKKEKATLRVPLQTITNAASPASTIKTSLSAPTEEAPVVPSSDALRSPATTLEDEPALATLDFQGLDSLIDGLATPPPASFDEHDPRRPLAAVAASPSIDRYGSEFQPPRSPTEEEVTQEVPGKRFMELRDEMNTARRSFERDLRVRAKRVESSVAALCHELAASPEKKDRTLRKSLAENLEEMKARLEADAAEETAHAEGYAAFQERMASMKLKVKQQVSTIQAEVSEHTTQCKSLLEAKSTLSKDILELQESLQQMQTQLDHDKSAVYGALTGNEPLLALQATHSLELTHELSGVEISELEQEHRKLEQAKPHVAHQLAEAENGLADRIAGEAELGEMRGLLVAKLTQGPDADPDEKRALEGEVSAMDAKLLMSQQAMGLQRKLVAGYEAKLAGLEERMAQLTTRQGEKKHAMGQAAEAFAQRAEALMGALHGMHETAPAPARAALPVMTTPPVVEPLVVLGGEAAGSVVVEEREEEVVVGKFEASNASRPSQPSPSPYMLPLSC